MQEGKLGKGLKEFLNKSVVEKGKNKEALIVVDPKLGTSSMSFVACYAFSFIVFSTSNQ